MENTIELTDYLRVIWKRKILVIVGTLVCMVVAGVVSLRLPEICRAEALMRIGKVVNTVDFHSISFNSVDTTTNLVKTIPVEYALEGEEASRYSINAEAVKETSLIRIIMKGPAMGKAKEFLKKVVEKITADHYRMTESSIQFYKALVETRETDINNIKKGLDQKALAEELNKDLDKKIDVYLEEGMDVDLVKEMGIDIDIDEINPLTLILIRNKMIELQNAKLRMKQLSKNDLNEGLIKIRAIQDDILLYQLNINSLKENKTRMIGEVVGISIKPKTRRNIILAGVAGLIVFLLIAFFIEFLGTARVRGE